MSKNLHTLGLLSCRPLLSSCPATSAAEQVPSSGLTLMLGRCTDMVDRSAKLPNSRVLFLPTLFWVSRHEEGYFDNNEVRSYLTPLLRTVAVSRGGVRNVNISSIRGGR